MLTLLVNIDIKNGARGAECDIYLAMMNSCRFSSLINQWAHSLHSDLTILPVLTTNSHSIGLRAEVHDQDITDHYAISLSFPVKAVKRSLSPKRRESIHILIMRRKGNIWNQPTGSTCLGMVVQTYALIHFIL